MSQIWKLKSQLWKLNLGAKPSGSTQDLTQPMIGPIAMTQTLRVL